MAETPAKLALAADIGGTHMRAALVNSDGIVLDRESIDTHPERGIEEAANRLADIAASIQARANGEIVGLGASSAGPIDPVTGVYTNPPNLTGWDGKSLKPLLEERLKIPVHFGHDATLAAFAETSFGPHKGAKQLIYVTVSTGVGGGIIANGEMVTGARGHAGEVGHLTVNPGGDSCNVGCDGCFEGNASGTAIANKAKRQVKAGEQSSLLSASNEHIENITAAMVFEAAENGDAVSLTVQQEVIEHIGVGLGGLLNSFDPEALVVGGGVMVGLKSRWNDVMDAVARHSLHHFPDPRPVHLTTFGDDVSLIGAAGLAFRNAG